MQAKLTRSVGLGSWRSPAVSTVPQASPWGSGTLPRALALERGKTAGGDGIFLPRLRCDRPVRLADRDRGDSNSLSAYPTSLSTSRASISAWSRGEGSALKTAWISPCGEKPLKFQCKSDDVWGRLARAHMLRRSR